MIVAIITSVIVFVYLIFQSFSDVKTMQVYTFPNNIAVVFSVLLYAWDCIRMDEGLPIGTIAVFFIIIFLSKLGVYGVGDAKAMAVIYLTLRYWYSSYPHPNLTVFLFAILAANVMFLLAHGKYLIRRKRMPDREKRAAYFPFLTIGYAAGIVLGIMNY